MDNQHITGINLKVALMDTDYYAMQAINGYLAWDRRTRVILLSESWKQLWGNLDALPAAELPDVVVLDAEAFDHPGGLREAVLHLRERVPRVRVVCLARYADLRRIEAAVEAEARAYLLKSEVTLHIAWAIIYALERDLLVTAGIHRAAARSMNRRLRDAAILPHRREYRELTERIRQAIELCVVKGMPAQLAADEMGISLHTIRSYIKEGYRILESADETIYPVEMSPQEKAFMRITRIEDEA
ncbi:MAG: sigma-70 region 4 domain-containing protein [Anaerolineae bacterium]|nr:sigma-70 region 4 domain-containing protein [Anaerolineae bacterium]NUQ06244.1 sigma-70 region 4 domain-containing protein [Anaerolineae bacterium]